ncbi:MAG: FeoB-associated Cys-rich membrane protein [Kiritimatiellae bacterium]|nr:FeoB-associated Cys-rich membrane protein [Kiritimatiellia bacterium]
MNLASVLVIALIVAFAALSVWRCLKKGAPCSCGCDGEECACCHGGKGCSCHGDDK